MMKRAHVLTPWIGSGAVGNAYRPQLARDYALASCLDATAQPASSILPLPNLHAVEIVCTDAVLAQIAADPHYHLIWSEPT
jgi:hypothetical protein